jgi:flagellar biosynthesis/type III secretory pathway chaperone
MPATEMIEKLISILETERDLLRQYHSDCEILHRKIASKNWAELEKLLQKLRKEAESLANADDEREVIISMLKKEADLPEEVSFGLLLSRFSDDVSRRINELKREIRRSITILQSRMTGIGRYTESRTSALKDMLDILVPDQKGKIYDKNGAASNIGSKPMLFSKHF